MYGCVKLRITDLFVRSWAVLKCRRYLASMHTEMGRVGKEAAWNDTIPQFTWRLLRNEHLPKFDVGYHLMQVLPLETSFSFRGC